MLFALSDAPHNSKARLRCLEFFLLSFKTYFLAGKTHKRCIDAVDFHRFFALPWQLSFRIPCYHN